MALLRRCTDGLGLLRRGLAPDAFPTAARALVQGCRPCDVPQICSGCAANSIKETAIVTFEGLQACEGCIIHPPQGSWEVPADAVLSGMFELPQILDDDGDFTCVYQRVYVPVWGTFGGDPLGKITKHLSQNFDCSSSAFAGVTVEITLDLTFGNAQLSAVITGTMGASLFFGSATFGDESPLDCGQQVVIDNEIDNCDPRHFSGGVNTGGTATVDFV